MGGRPPKGKLAKRGEDTPPPPAPPGAALRFWGVRGTMPTPGASTLKYGGNTSCVEFFHPASPGSPPVSVVCDAGSGLCAYGEAALVAGQREFHILLSHMHYDHIIGLTRFPPLFRGDCTTTLYGQGKGGLSLEQIFDQFFSAPFFPLAASTIKKMTHIRFVDITSKAVTSLSHFRIEWHPLNHPQEALAFRLTDVLDGHSVVYATDHEHQGLEHPADLIAFVRHTDVLLYDATFHNEQYPRHVGWGHSTAQMGARLAAEASVGRFGIFHLEPDSSDDVLETCHLPEAKAIFPNSFLCREGLVLDLSQKP